MSIQLNKRGRHEVRWLENGRHRSRSFADNAAAQMFETALKNGEAEEVVKGAKALSEYGLTWFREYVLVDLSRNSQTGYAAVWDRYVVPAPIALVPVAKITPRHIREFRNRVFARVQMELVAEQERRLREGLPPPRGRGKNGLPTVRKVLAVLSSLIGYAREDGAYPMKENPVHLVSARTGRKRKISASTNGRWYGNPLAIDEVEKIICEVIRRRTKGRARTLDRDLVILELLALGLRPEEIYGLDVADVLDGRIAVRQALARDEIEPVKSVSSIRRVRGEPTRMRTIEDYARRRLEGGARPSDPLLVNQRGRRISDSGIRNWGRRVFGPAVRALGFEEAVPYLFRHSRAAHLLAAGYTNGECADQLGHSLATFMRVYASVVKGSERHSISSLEEEVARARKAVRLARLSHPHQSDVRTTR